MPTGHAYQDIRPHERNPFRAGIVAALLGRAQELGIDSGPWFRDTRLVPADFIAPEPPYLSYQDACGILRRALDALPGEGHGLALGGRQSLPDFGVLGLAMLASSTFLDALRTGIRFAPVSGAMLALAIVDDPVGAAVTMRMYQPDPRLEVYLCEELLASCLNLCRSVLGPAFRPERVDLAYPAPAHADRYVRLLRTDVKFGARDNRILIARRWLDQPMPAANPRAAQQLAELCRAEMPPGASAESIAATIEHRLAISAAQPPGLDALANELQTTARTLRRKLLAEGTSYRELLDRVRERAARRLLADRSLTLGRIAVEVGFSDPRDFRRAFKRWTGCSPSDVRRDAAPPVGQ